MAYERDPKLPANIETTTYVGQPDKKAGTLFSGPFDEFYRTHERMLWSLSDYTDELNRGVETDPKMLIRPPKGELVVPAPSRFRPELTTQAQIDSLTATMYVESHNPVYAAGLLSYPANRMDMQESSFLAVWTYEEFKHFAGSLNYIEAIARAAALNPNDRRIPRVDLDAVAEKLAKVRAGQWGEKEGQFTRVQAYTYTLLQELLTWYVYTENGHNAEEPMLVDLYGNMAKEEMRHHVWYYDRTFAALHPDPENFDHMDPQALEEFESMLMMFYMPGDSFIPNYADNADAMQGRNDGKKIGKVLLNKVQQLVGAKHVDHLLGRKDFQNSLTARGISHRDILGLRMQRKLGIGR